MKKVKLINLFSARLIKRYDILVLFMVHIRVQLIWYTVNIKELLEFIYKTNAKLLRQGGSISMKLSLYHV